jgi:DNA-binding transcriptional MocR family regulator
VGEVLEARTGRIVSLFPDDERWAEVASGLADGIETRRYQPRECLGTPEELAVACIAGRPEMYRALAELERRGYVSSKNGSTSPTIRRSAAHRTYTRPPPRWTL